MADDPKQPSPGLGGNAFLWLAVVAAVTAYVGHPHSLENLRPPAAELRNVRLSTGQDIDARLWQDPFESVLKSVGDYYGWTRSDGAHNDDVWRNCSTDRHYCSPLGDPDNKEADAIGIMVPGSPYSEDAEFRRRVRYAVLSGLSIQGYVPVDEQRIGTFIPDPRDQEMPKFVPYEFVQKSSDSRRPRPRLALFWLDEDVLSRKPLNQLAGLFDRLMLPAASVEQVGSATPPNEGQGTTLPNQKAADHLRVRIIAPQASKTLLEMVKNLQDLPDYPPGKDNQEQSNARFEIYDYGATVDAAALCRQSCDCDTAQLRESPDWLEQKFRKKGFRFLRAITNDEVLARSINAELQRRGVNTDTEKPANIALVSEWDTYYGRSLPNLFARCLTPGADPRKPEACDQHSSDVDIDRNTREHIRRFSYLRGLDGETAASVASKRPGAAPAPANASNAQGYTTASGGGVQPQTSDAGVPLLSSAPVGQGQGDYLLRLADQLKQHDEDLWRAKGERLQAVGVLGDDVYDKLLVIQALRAALPRAVFFTTDLDARLIHPGQRIWTRNLLVASGFGLSLRRELQRYVPPFRSSYQTAAFLATLVAAGPSSSDETADLRLNSAELFEIGRTKAIRLNDREVAAPQESDGLNCADWKQPVDVFQCGRLQPTEMRESAPRFVLALGLALVKSVLIFAFLLLLLWLCCGRAWFSRKTSLPVGAGLFLIILAALFSVEWWWPAIELMLSKNGNGELTTPLESVSLWPSIGLKLLSVLLCVALIVHIGRVYAANVDQLASIFRMTELRSELEQEQPGRRLALQSRLREAFRWRIRDASEINSAPQDADATSPAAANEDASRRSSALVKVFWGRYLDYSRGWPQFLRVATAVALAMVPQLALYGVFGHGMPYRGWLAHDIYLGVAFADSLVTAALVFYVADRTLFSWLFVKEAFADVGSQAQSPSYVWPEQARKAYADRLGMGPKTASGSPGEDRAKDSVVAAIMSLHYVSMRTACVTNLIYYPFLMIGLMVLSRSTIFSSFPFDPVFIVSQLLSLAVAFASAMALRQAAEGARRSTQRLLVAEKLKALTSPQAEGFNRQLDLLRERVAAYSEGAFSPLSHQPVVRALLLPLGGYGGTVLLSTLTSANL